AATQRFVVARLPHSIPGNAKVALVLLLPLVGRAAERERRRRNVRVQRALHSGTGEREKFRVGIAAAQSQTVQFKVRIIMPAPRFISPEREDTAVVIRVLFDGNPDLPKVVRAMPDLCLILGSAQCWQ